jgi:hypothetical protein
MSTDPADTPGRPHAVNDSGPGYEPPRLTVLGTLAELTAGGNVSSQADGVGFAGGSGTLP